MAVRRSMFKEPLGVKWLKETKDVSVLDAFKIEVERQLLDADKEKRKTASYIYDKHARQAIKEIIYQIGSNLNEIEKHLKKIAKSIPTGKTNKNGKSINQTVYTLNKIDYEKVSVALFVRYKTKRMDLSKKEYVEKLTIEKMTNDFPYFSQDEKRNNAFNNLFLRHINEYKNDPKEAFSAEGLDKLNEKAIADPKIGKPIKSITRLDGTVEDEDMFNGASFETDKGAMAYFIMYENQKTKEREYPAPWPSIPTHKVIEKIVQGISISETREGFDTIILSPGDLVYVPSKEESEKIKTGTKIEKAIPWEDRKYLKERIYKIVSFSKKDLLCVKANISDPIIPTNIKEKIKGEIDWHNKSTTTMESDITIKDVCIKLKVDRLGNIKPAL